MRGSARSVECAQRRPGFASRIASGDADPSPVRSLRDRPSSPHLRWGEGYKMVGRLGQLTSGGIEESMVSMLAPCLKPNMVPRS